MKYLVIVIIILITIALILWLRSSQESSGSLNEFPHGIASGDPLQDRVILWTRVEIPQVEWKVALDPGMVQVVQSGTVSTGPKKDWTVKVDVVRLIPGTTYYYQFSTPMSISTIGRTKTLPVGYVKQWKMAVTSCASYNSGYYHAYQQIAESDVDVVLNLGDYIYADENSSQVRSGANKETLIPLKSLTLNEYRNVYKLYKSDKSLQSMHSRHPMISIWDDHEFINNCWKDGPNKDGQWNTRKANAMKAWFEYLPVRDPQVPGKIWRDFTVGNLLNLYMLDSRIWGKDQGLDGYNDKWKQEGRQILGKDQEDWIVSQVNSSTNKWQVIAQEVMMAKSLLPNSIVESLRTKKLSPNINDSKVPSKKDLWSSYPYARESLLTQLQSNQGQDIIFLSGDFHNAMFSEVRTESGNLVGYEFLTPSVSSRGIENKIKDFPQIKPMIKASLPDVKFFDMEHRGWTLMDFTPERTKGTFYLIEDNTKLEAKTLPPVSFEVR